MMTDRAGTSSRLCTGLLHTRPVTTQTPRTRCEYLHVDFDDDLSDFYLGACGFTPTNAGLLTLQD